MLAGPSGGDAVVAVAAVAAAVAIDGQEERAEERLADSIQNQAGSSTTARPSPAAE